MDLVLVHDASWGRPSLAERQHHGTIDECLIFAAPSTINALYRCIRTVMRVVVVKTDDPSSDLSIGKAETEAGVRYPPV